MISSAASIVVAALLIVTAASDGGIKFDIFPKIIILQCRTAVAYSILTTKRG
jgi:hypothetical protein